MKLVILLARVFGEKPFRLVPLDEDAIADIRIRISPP